MEASSANIEHTQPTPHQTQSPVIGSNINPTSDPNFVNNHQVHRLDIGKKQWFLDIGIIVHYGNYLENEPAFTLLQHQMCQTYVHWVEFTHLCACHCDAHCVVAVNKKTVPFLCNSGRSLIAFEAFHHEVITSATSTTTTTKQ